MSEALQLELLERHLSTERLVAAMSGGSLPDLFEAREMFADYLAAPFTAAAALDPVKADLMDALGLRRAG